MLLHETYMRRCLELAQRGKGWTSPNPMVGAVLVYDGRIIGEGWHRKNGEAHAEVEAIESVKEADRHLIAESTIYVSLEPCAHWGKQPPCAERIVKEGIKKVVACNDDPFEAVKGRGYAILEAAGIEVTKGVMTDAGRWVNRRFFCAQEQSRPYIILKWAQTMNGFFAPLNRTRYQMSNKRSQILVHKWRTEEDAILIGTKTALHDDPQLTARLWEGKQPLRVVIDKHGELPEGLRVLDDQAETIVITDKEERGNTKHIRIPFDNGLLSGIMNLLHERKISSLIIEGGAHSLQQFIDAALWDEARVFITPPVLTEGIAPPVLSNSRHCLKSEIETDILHVYTNSNTRYPYVPGMEL